MRLRSASSRSNTDVDGGIINNPVLLRLGEDHFWLSVADGDVLLWAKGIASVLNLNVQIREPDVAPVQIQGPRSRDLMVDLFGEMILDIKYYWMGVPVYGRANPRGVHEPHHRPPLNHLQPRPQARRYEPV